MNNFNQPGSTLDLAAPYDRTSGQGAKIGAIFGVAKSTVLSGVTGEFQVEGVFTLAKTSAQAWVLGDRVYWDDTNKRCDNTSIVGMLIGYATAAAANPSSTGVVRLNEGTPGFVQGKQAAIADIATADGSDAGTTQTLANAIKAKLNTLLAELRLIGLI